MESLSFIEKLSILWQNIIAHPIFICILFVPIILLFLNKKTSAKIDKKVTISVYVGIVLIVLFIGGEVLFELFDNVIDNIFMALYFPNFVTLFFVEILSVTIMLITFLKKDIIKSRKIINVVSFIVIQFLFCLILTVIKVNDLNIYEENTLYASSDVLTLMQLLMGMFALQIISLLVLYIIDKVADKLDGKEKPKLKVHKTKITHATIKPIVKVVPQEVKVQEFKNIKPIDYSLINTSKIKPIDLKEEIKKEQAIKQINSNAEILDLNKSIDTKSDRKDSKIKEENVLDFKPVYDSLKTSKTSMTPNIKDDIKLEEQVIPLKPLSKETIPKTNNEPSHKEKSMKVKNEGQTPFEAVVPIVIPKEEPKELITNLTIIDFDKTVKCVSNLKTVYTM